MFQIQGLTKKSQALALKVPLRHISEIIQYFSTYLLPGTKVQSIDGEKEYKRIFLIPELSPEVQTWLKEHQIEQNAQEVVLHANDVFFKVKDLIFRNFERIVAEGNRSTNWI